MAISGCGNACSHPQISDIGFIGTKVRNESGNRVDGYDVILGGQLHGLEGSRFAHKTDMKIEADNLVDFVSELIISYEIDNLGKNTFKEYLNIVEFK